MKEEQELSYGVKTATGENRRLNRYMTSGVHTHESPPHAVRAIIKHLLSCTPRLLSLSLDVSDTPHSIVSRVKDEKRERKEDVQKHL